MYDDLIGSRLLATRKTLEVESQGYQNIGLRDHEAFFRESYEPPMLSVIPLARAIQFAKKMGAKVIAVSRQNWVKEFGERNSWIKILFPDRNFISTQERESGAYLQMIYKNFRIWSRSKVHFKPTTERAGQECTDNLPLWVSLQFNSNLVMKYLNLIPIFRYSLHIDPDCLMVQV